jgi:hypothetical protein
MPLAPRLQPTRPSRPRIEDPELKDLPGEELVAYISASRMGILFPRNSADPGDSVSMTIRPESPFDHFGRTERPSVSLDWVPA